MKIKLLKLKAFLSAQSSEGTLLIVIIIELLKAIGPKLNSVWLIHSRWL